MRDLLSAVPDEQVGLPTGLQRLREDLAVSQDCQDGAHVLVVCRRIHGLGVNFHRSGLLGN